MSDVAITATRLTKKFGDFTAVDHISFNVEKGEIFGLLGPNGAGKSTVIRMLSTLSTSTEGSATVAGFDVRKEAAKVREHIGLVSEKMIMYDELTARENLTLFGKLYDIPSDVLEKRIGKLLDFVRMQQWADHRIDTFSTGMKQRINVIRALVNQPEILFLDEPTLGLDPQSTAEVRELVRRINIENRTTIILTTHMMTEADMLCDRIGIIDRGKIVAMDTPAGLKRSVSGSDAALFEFEIPNLDSNILSSVKSTGSVSSVVQDDPTHIKVSSVGDDSFDILVDVLRKNGAQIRTVRNLEPTLEDVFLKITGHEVRDEVAKAPVPQRRGGPPGMRPKKRVR
ncbi:MAG: ATP-binding cassette domain-containing protein [Candidatus Thermoplasmatota archaeon]|nr:ATP-binding cassette domain-containing protein [Candidatus Thermoplasmatota archaeon]